MDLSFTIKAKASEASFKEVERVFGEYIGHMKSDFSALQADFSAINGEITEYTSFSFLAKEQVNKAIDSLKGVASKSWDDFEKTTGKQMEKALGQTWDAFTDNIGELDNGKLERAWSQFGDSLVEGVHTSWHGMLDNMGNALTGLITIRPRGFPRGLMV